MLSSPPKLQRVVVNRQLVRVWHYCQGGNGLRVPARTRLDLRGRTLLFVPSAQMSGSEEGEEEEVRVGSPLRQSRMLLRVRPSLAGALNGLILQHFINSDASKRGSVGELLIT